MSKGSKRRPGNDERYRSEYERCFGLTTKEKLRADMKMHTRIEALSTLTHMVNIASRIERRAFHVGLEGRADRRIFEIREDADELVKCIREIKELLERAL